MKKLNRRRRTGSDAKRLLGLWSGGLKIHYYRKLFAFIKKSICTFLMHDFLNSVSQFHW